MYANEFKHVHAKTKNELNLAGTTWTELEQARTTWNEMKLQSRT